MNALEFQHKCYEAYQLQWMISHGSTLDEFLKTIKDIACETMSLDNDYCVISAETELTNLINQSHDAFTNEAGFCGSLFVCEKEFLETEYLDPDYMLNLLSQMPDSENCKMLWEKFTNFTLPNPNVLQTRCEYIMPIKKGKLSIVVIPDTDYPGLDIEYISDKDASLPENTVFTKPRVLIENNENVLRALVWGDRDNEDYTDAVDFTCTENRK